jgi:sigma-B regulation protein RsbU (phosphoserine phosphatase)
MPRLLFKSFASRLSFYILLLTTGIFVCIAAIFGRYTTDRANKHAELYSSALLKTILNDTELELDDVEHLVEVIKDRVTANLNRPDSLASILADMVTKDNIVMGGCVAFEPGFYADQRELFMEYVYLDEHSGKLVRKHLDGKTYDYPHMEWYAKPMATKQDVWSDPYCDDGGGDRLMITYSLPMFNLEGKAIGVVTADVAIEELVEYIDWMRPYSDGYTFVINSHGAYISHPDSTAVLTQDVFSRAKATNCKALADIGRKMIARESGAEEFTMDGEKMIACYSPMDRTGWSACYLCPYKSIIDTMGDVLIYLYLFLLFWLVLLIVFIRRIILRETKPMEQLTQAAYRVSSGDFDVPLPEIHTEDELLKLRDGFGYMQNSLKQYIAQLTEATRTKERIASELSIAHDIQMNLVPHDFANADAPNIDLHATLMPAKEVGGDFYDFLIRDNRLYFAIGDVSGKGVPAALIMAITRSRFRLYCEGKLTAAEIVAGLNRALCSENDAFMFVTMFVGVLDLATNRLTYCNAGHNPPVVVGPQGCRFLEVVPNLPLGVEAEMQYAEQSEQLQANSGLLLYTDGLTEAERTDHQQFGEARMLQALEKLTTASAKTVVENLQQAIAEFVDGAEPSDDLTLFCVRVKPGVSTDDSELQIKSDVSTDDGDSLTAADASQPAAELSLTMTNSITELPRLQQFVEQLAERYGIADDVAGQLNLALEEAVVNIINYAYPPGESGDIRLTAACSNQALTANCQEEPSAANGHGRTLTLTIEDNGKPFDPTAVPEADTTLPLEQREIGGLGIFLIRNIMDTVAYRRLPAANRLTLAKSL